MSSQPTLFDLAEQSKSSSAVQYRDIQGFPGYRVGDDGSVWSRKRKTSSPWRKLHGYWNSGCYRQVCLFKGGKRIQRSMSHLVLEAFVGARPPGYQALHDPDPNPDNCSLANLRWGTPAENMEDMIKQGRRVDGRQEKEIRIAAKAADKAARKAARVAMLGGRSPQRLWQKTQIAAGNCKRCGKPRERYASYCDSCHEKARVKERLRIQKKRINQT